MDSKVEGPQLPDQNFQIDSSNSKIFDDEDLQKTSPAKDEQDEDDNQDSEGSNKYVEEHKQIVDDEYRGDAGQLQDDGGERKVARPTTKPLDKGRRKHVNEK